MRRFAFPLLLKLVIRITGAIAAIETPVVARNRKADRS
jgi:hypothetical protein